MVLISRPRPGLPWVSGYDGTSTQAGKGPSLGGECWKRGQSNLSCFICRAEGMDGISPREASGALTVCFLQMRPPPPPPAKAPDPGHPDPLT